MLYTLFVLTLGVYIGQEYDNLPAVKLLLRSGLVYLTTNLQTPSNNPETILDTIYKFWSDKKN
jgi:hypothetical protein